MCSEALSENRALRVRTAKSPKGKGKVGSVFRGRPVLAQRASLQNLCDPQWSR